MVIKLGADELELASDDEEGAEDELITELCDDDDGGALDDGTEDEVCSALVALDVTA